MGRSIILPCALVLPGCFNPTVDRTNADTEGSTDSSAMDSTAADADTASSGPSSSTVGSDSEGEGETSHAVCGDRVVEGEEVCDDGVNDGSYGGCAPDCRSLGPHCGDGIKNGDEECDDGDDTNGNGCNNDCIVSGTVLWTRTYDATKGWGVAVGSADAVITAGGEELDGPPYQRSRTLLYSSDGELQWSTVYEGLNNAEAVPAAVAADDSRTVVVGMAQGTGASWAWFQELDTNGVPNWTATVGQTNQGVNVPYGVGLRSGFTYVGGILDNGVWLTKRDSNGGEVWTRFGPSTGGLRGIAFDSEGNVLVAGNALPPPPATGSTLWMRKYTSEGQTVWTHEGTPLQSHAAHAVTVGPSDEIVLAGLLDGEIWVSKRGPDGAEDWTVTVDGGGYIDQAYGITFDSSGDIIVVGEANRAIWIRKYDPTGTPRWTDTVGGANSGSFAWAVAVDSADNIVVSGTLHQGGTSYGWVRKYTP